MLPSKQMWSLIVSFCKTVYRTIWGLFPHDEDTIKPNVQFWVVVTTLLLLGKFAVVSMGPWLFSRRSATPGVRLIVMLNYTALHYTLGLMSSSRDGRKSLNSFFQVWAVLIVTMSYGVDLGQQYKAIEMSLIDLLSSLWSANLLSSSETPLHLKIPLWHIWSANAWRIIRHYNDSKRAAIASGDNMKLVSDYMATSQHITHQGTASPTTMNGYKYLVLGEERQEMRIQRLVTEGGRPSVTMEFIDTRPEELITLEKVWRLREGSDRLLGRDADSDNRFKDVCLSFALYKLLRRRFFDFPISEAEDPATRNLVVDAILEDTNDYERAFRITEVELSFLHDFCYTKHAAVFAGGFPIQRLVLSLVMLVSLGYVALAICYLPNASKHFFDVPIHGAADDTDDPENLKQRYIYSVTHGVFVTHFIITIIVCKEIWEIVIYAFSQWTKILIICHYVKLKEQQWMRKWLTEKVARTMFAGIRRGHWDQKIRQYNLLLSARAGSRACSWLRRHRRRQPSVKLEVQAKKALFVSLKALDPRHGNPLEECSLQTAFPGDGGIGIRHLLGELKGESETHKVLVWHVATCLCQIDLLEKAQQPTRLYRELGSPFVRGSAQVNEEAAPQRPAHYTTAVSLSNYSAYLVTQELVPDNGLVASKVFEAVHDETGYILSKCSTNKEIYDTLVVPARQRIEQRHLPVSIVEIGADLSVLLMSMYNSDNDKLWECLGRFWAGYLLQLSTWTRAAKHEAHLRGRGELTMHLWVLLSHAGFLGPRHGHQLLDPLDQDI